MKILPISKRLVSESMAERNAAWCGKLEEIVPKEVFSSALNDEKYHNSNLPGISISHGWGDKTVDIRQGKSIIYTIKQVVGGFVMRKRDIEKWEKKWPDKQFEGATVDELYNNARFAKEILAIAKIPFSPTAAGQERMAAKASQALADAAQAIPQDILEKAFADSRTQEDLGWAKLWCSDPELNFGSKKVYISPKGSNGHWELIQKRDGITYTLTKMVFSQTYQDSTPRGKPRVFTANSVGELYQSADFAKAVADMKRDNQAGLDKRAKEKAEEDALKAPSTIYFKSYAALCAFLYEFSGQISDGLYENTKPFYHWVWLNKAKCIVDPNHEEGYMGPAHLVGYRFNDLIRQGRGHGWQRRLMKYVWFGSILDATHLDFPEEKLKGARTMVEQLFDSRNSDLTGEDIAQMGSSKFDDDELDEIAHVISDGRYRMNYEDACNSSVRSFNDRLSGESSEEPAGDEPVEITGDL